MPIAYQKNPTVKFPANVGLLTNFPNVVCHSFEYSILYRYLNSIYNDITLRFKHL
jgi:hypothetical protein